MPRTTIDHLIINSPYEEPQRHWRYDRQTRAFDDPGIFVEIPLVNQIRPRVSPSARQAIQALLISCRSYAVGRVFLSVPL